MEKEIVISIKDLKKIFDKKEVLKGINLSIGKGDFYGIFGKNGAGKSTLFKHILGLIRETSGEILIGGEKISKSKLRIGYLPENIALYGNMSVVDNLKVAAMSAGGKLSKKDIAEILDKVNLTGSERVKANDLSLGMKRRLQLAMATMTKESDILILDEPTNGMDVNGVIWLKQYLKNLKKTGKTILICSHSLNIMEELIDRYCIIIDGKIVNDEAWNYKELQNYCYSIELDEEKCSYNKAKQLLEEIGDIQKADDGRLNVTTKYKILPFCEILMKEEIPALDVTVEKESLEKIFIESVGING